MKKPLLILFTLAAAMAAQAADRCDNPAAAIALTDQGCGGELKAPQLSCYAPRDVEGELAQFNYNSVQRAANIYAWQQFIAINWPAANGQRGEPAAGKPITAPGPRVWETWKDDYEVYLPDGARPAPWNSQQEFPAACRGSAKMLVRDNKVSDVVDQTLQALPANGLVPDTLKDQDGKLVRYEIRLNKVVFDYIAENGYYNSKNQRNADAINYPYGSQIAKAAWREVDGDEADYFLTTNACVCDDTKKGGLANCRTQKMGLAGLHLMSKTPSAPQWVWSTYEQVDNTTAIHKAVTPLNDPTCSPEDCPPNMQTPGNTPTQLTRVIPIPNQPPICGRPMDAVDNLAQLNGDVQKALRKKNSVLGNYELVGTQWPVYAESGDGAKTQFVVKPALLGNTTMESFSQNTSTCMGCHVMSRSLNPHKYVSGDFTFTLNNAHPKVKGASCSDVEASVSCSDAILPSPGDKPANKWQRENWDAIKRGYKITTSTYETLGSRYVGNKMHCQTCHLDGAGNPNAAWWVGMNKRYPNKEGTTLTERINGCFERSMNGYPLCNGKECDKDKNMQALLTYMDYLDRQYKEKHPKGKPVHGYPTHKYNPVNANAARGREAFVQKCAFCHNNNGQGRYEQGVYFRPALWGPDAYNACSGMAKPDTFASFIKANMPYTSGGMLTGQEADDITAYVNTQCLPGKGGVDANNKVCSLSPVCKDGQQVKRR